MTVLLGAENTRVLSFGKRHRLSVTLHRIDGWWHAHAALMPRPVRNFRDARPVIRDQLERMAKEGK